MTMLGSNVGSVKVPEGALKLPYPMLPPVLVVGWFVPN